MSAVNIPEAKNSLKPEQVTVQGLLIENGQLIETAAEYQRMGRIEDAIKYQEMLHKNLIYLAKLADSNYTSHLLQELGGVTVPVNEQQPVAAQPVAMVSPLGTQQQHPQPATVVGHTSPPQLLAPPVVQPHPQQHHSPTQPHQSPHLTQATTAQQSPSSTVAAYQRVHPAMPPPMPNQQQHTPQMAPPAAQHHAMIYGTAAQGHHQYAPVGTVYSQPMVQQQHQFVAHQQYQMTHPQHGAYPPVSSHLAEAHHPHGFQHQQVMQPPIMPPGFMQQPQQK